jgi:hypothetical protein
MKKLTDQDRERLLTAVIYLARTGAEIYRDYRSGDCAGVAREIIGLAKKIRQMRKKKGKK